MENNLPHFITLREFTIVRQLLKKEPQLKDLSVHSSILAWRIPWTEEPGGLQSTGSQRVTHDFTFTFTFCLVQPLSHVWLCYTMHCRMPGFPVHHQLPEPAQTHVHHIMMPSNHLILCHPLLLTPSIFPSIRVFSSGLILCIRWPKFQLYVSPSNEYSALISLGWNGFIS